MLVWPDSSRSRLRRYSKTREQRDFYRCLASRQGGLVGRTQSIAYGWGDSAPVNEPCADNWKRSRASSKTSQQVCPGSPGTSQDGGGGIRTQVGGNSRETVFEPAAPCASRP